MEIKNFSENVRLGHDVFIDVRKISGHCSEGVMATAYMFKSDDKYTKRKVEVRKKDNSVALITYYYSDTKLPEYWQDAEVLFTWEQEDNPNEHN
jgi:hypothetical protein